MSAAEETIASRKLSQCLCNNAIQCVSECVFAFNVIVAVNLCPHSKDPLGTFQSTIYKYNIYNIQQHKIHKISKCMAMSVPIISFHTLSIFNKQCFLDSNHKIVARMEACRQSRMDD